MMKFFQILLLIFVFVPFSLYGQSSELANDLKEHVRILASPEMEGRGLGTAGIELAREYIIDEFEAAGLEPIGESFLHPFQIRLGLAWVPAFNIVGKIPGNDPDLRDEVIVIGAHYDHMGYVIRADEKVIYHGADDNASGTATLIELAKYFSANREQIGRTIVFAAFDAEESGLHGARRFVGDSIVNPADIKLMFSLDMVGMLEEYGGLDMKGVGALDGGEEVATRIAGEKDIRIKARGHQIERRTDTWPFGNVGIPAIHVFTGLTSPYHQPEDTYDLLDYDGMASVKKYMARLVTEYSNAPQLQPSSSFIAAARVVDGQVVEIRRPFFNYGIISHIGSGHHIYRDEFFDANSVFNFGIGLYAQFHLSNKFALQPEVLFDWNGSKWVEDNFRRQSLTAPLNIQFNLFTEGTDARVFVLAGPYFRYNFGGKAGDISMDYDEVFSETEWGYNIGFGVEISRFHFGFTSRRALTDIYQNESAFGEIRDASAYFTFGIKF